jgi:Putative zinc-finger
METESGNHDQFEDLIVMLALGEITADGRELLKAHLADCAECRKVATQYHALTRLDLPLVHEEESSTESIWEKLERNRRARFVESAEHKGYHFSDSILRSQARPRWGNKGFQYMLRAAAVVILAVVLTTALLQVSSRRMPSRTNQVADLQQQVAKLQANEARLLAVLEQENAAEGNAAVEFGKLQEEVSILKREAAAKQRQLDAQAQTSDVLRRKLDQEDMGVAAVEKKLAEAEASLAQAKAENKALLDAHRTDELLAATQQKRLDDLMHELQAKGTVIGQTQLMMSADRDIRDLMGARQLHIVDVYDANSAGQRQKRFGRVFYTEGKSLVFYAFDLTNSGVVEAKESFQAWGTKYGGSNMAVNLGVFYVDDKSQRRWALKVEDPALLNEIDSVFVTAEPSAHGKKPTGRRLLFAYLKNPANHP